MSAAGSTVGSNCPGCGQALGPRELRGVKLGACDACSALLVQQRDLMPALEALSAEVIASFDPDSKLQALPDRAAGIACPACRRSMEKADYCSANLVFFARCNPCGLLWIGDEELGAMSLMWARMEARVARTRAQSAENLSAMNAMVDAAHLRRVVQGSLRTGAMVLGVFGG